MDNKRKLFASAWIGELGWELFCWQGYLRAIAENYDYVTVVSRPGHEILYADFADKFIPFAPSTGETNMWMCDGAESHAHLHRDARREGRTTILDPIILWDRFRNKGKDIVTILKPQKFVKYGTHSPDTAYDVVYHARSTKKKGSAERNWPTEKWNEFADNFDKSRIAAIGSPDGAYHVEGTVDLRGIPLAKLVNVLASSGLLVGTSSGPMHLGALCGCPLLVWSGVPKSVPRYTTEWNPLNTPVVMMMDGGWNPEVEEVLTQIDFLRFVEDAKVYGNPLEATE